MKKMLLLSGALLVVCASVAAAAPHLNLAWDTCVGDGGLSLRTTSCVSNLSTGANANTLVPSVVFDQDVLLFNGFDTHVIIATAGPLPAWWGVGCAGKTSPIFSSAPTSLCSLDPFELNGGGGNVPLTGTDLYPNPSAIQVRFAFAVPEGLETTLLATGEYPTCNFVISNAKSSGVGACVGCATPACINFKSVTMGQKGGIATDLTQGGSAVAFWQSNTASCAGATPTHNSTWGSVKALYR